MGEGFKLLDAYVEVTASGKGLAAKVAGDIRTEGASHLTSAGSSMGTSLLGGFKGVLGAGVVSGIVSSFGYSVMNQVQNVVGQGFMAAKGAVIDFNSQLENSTIGFTTMLGSAQKAQVFLGQLQDFAKTTPFEFGNLVSNAQQMMGMGIAAKDVIPDLRALGDSVAAMGGNVQQVDQVTLAFDQMASKGTLDMGNMNQLLQGGVPSALKILAASYKVSTGEMIKMISTGKVQSDVALPALVKGIEKGTKATAALGGMMDKQSATFTGAMSNIADGLNQTIAHGFQPFFKILEEGAVKMAAFVSTKQFAGFVNGIATAMTGGFKKVQGFVSGITDLFAPVHSPVIKVGGWLKQISQLPKPKNPLAGFVDALGSSAKHIPGDIKSAFTSLDKSAKVALPNLIEFGKSTAPRLITLFDKLIKLTPKVGEALGKLSPVLGAVGFVFNNFIDKAISPTVSKVSDLFDIFNGKKNALKTSYNDAVTGKLGTEWQILGTTIGIVATAVGTAIGTVHKHLDIGAKQLNDFFGGIGKWVGDLVGVIGQAFTIGGQIIDGLTGGIMGGIGKLVGAISWVIGMIPDVAKKLLGIASPSKVFHTIGTQVGQGLHLGLLGSVDQIKVTAGKLADAVRSGYSGSGVSTMVAYINREAKALEGLSAARAKAATRLANDRSNLSTILGNRSQFADSVRSGVTGSADITSLYGGATGAGMSTLNGVAYQPSYTSTSGLGGVSANLRGVLAATKGFTANLRTLVKMGIDPTTYGQLIAAGPMAAGALADQLVHDPAGFRDIVSLEKQIGRAASSLGTAAATQTYAGQVRAAQAAVKRDQGVVNHYTIAMTIDAKKIDDLGKLVHMVNRLGQTARAK